MCFAVVGGGVTLRAGGEASGVEARVTAAAIAVVLAAAVRANA